MSRDKDSIVFPWSMWQTFLYQAHHICLNTFIHIHFCMIITITHVRQAGYPSPSCVPSQKRGRAKSFTKLTLRVLVAAPGRDLLGDNTWEQSVSSTHGISLYIVEESYPRNTFSFSKIYHHPHLGLFPAITLGQDWPSFKHSDLCPLEGTN